MDLDEVRRLTITALFSDDSLVDRIVLKGGNALSLVYGFSSRSSLDLDFSIDGDFPDVEVVKTRIFSALRRRFSSVGFVVFDEQFNTRPGWLTSDQQNQWGGYELVFKIIETGNQAAINGEIDAMRRNAVVVGPEQQRKLSVDLSKFEYCGGKSQRVLDDYTIYVYTPAMLAVEKLRAICQQMSEYEHAHHPHPRARDFYDIHLLANEAGVNLESAAVREIVRTIFDAKQVPLALIDNISAQREFHRPDWPSVEGSTTGKLEGFDFYFDYVVGQTAHLKTLWIK